MYYLRSLRRTIAHVQINKSKDSRFERMDFRFLYSLRRVGQTSLDCCTQHTHVLLLKPITGRYVGKVGRDGPGCKRYPGAYFRGNRTSNTSEKRNHKHIQKMYGAGAGKKHEMRRQGVCRAKLGAKQVTKKGSKGCKRSCNSSRPG